MEALASRLKGGTYGRTDVRTKYPLHSTGHRPSGTAAQKGCINSLFYTNTSLLLARLIMELVETVILELETRKIPDFTFRKYDSVRKK